MSQSGIWLYYFHSRVLPAQQYLKIKLNGNRHDAQEESKLSYIQRIYIPFEFLWFFSESMAGGK